MTTRLTGAQVATPTGLLDGVVVVVRDGFIAGVDAAGVPGADGAETLDLTGLFILPGFIDLHVHGGGGATFDDGGDSIATGLAAHRMSGTTRSLVSLVTAPADDMARNIAAAAQYAAGDPTVLGLHLEGPFLSVDRRGVHDPTALLMPDPVVLERFLAAGAGQIAMVTVAPELPGGLDLVHRLVAAGVHPAIGHSDAGYEVARQAFRAGADVVTHAFNGMRPLHHRDPAIIGAAMDAGVVLEVINDGVHLHEATVRLLRSIAPGRLALITDAMAATSASDGSYRLGAFDVQVQDGVARLADGTIAGSTLTMGVAVQRAVQLVGMSLVEAANAASLVPATVLGVAEKFGSIQVGRAADLVIIDTDLTVQAVMVAGRWVRPLPGGPRVGP
jgi:N-acetylglucosamine-6-phosphate deacetylase